MIEWPGPRTLSEIVENDFTKSDIAFLSGLDRRTISRFWDDPDWMDRASGRSLQALIATIPSVADYFRTLSDALISRGRSNPL